MKKSIIQHLDSIFIFLISMVIFPLMIKYVTTDIRAHIDQIQKINLNKANYPPNFIFYFFTNLLSGFSNSRFMLYISTSILLSLANTFKFIISKKIIFRFSNFKYNSITLSVLALLLFFSFPIPDFYNVFILQKLYLGRFGFTTWHNSTTILLFPFALLLFWKQLHFLENKQNTKTDLLFLLFLIIINIFIKPSFIFVYLPVTFYLILNKFKFNDLKKTAYHLLPIFIGGLFILVQYFLIYHFQIGSYQKESSGISISTPFKMISYWVPYWYIPISILFSYTLPIFSMIFYKEILKFKPFFYSLLLTIFGILIYAFIIETGPRALHANFSWQIIITSYLLMLSTIIFLAPRLLNKNEKSKKILFLKILLLIHSLSGILYLIKIAVTRSYS